MKKKILIIALSDLRFDARVRRQLEAVKDHYAVTVAGFGADSPQGYTLFTLRPTPLTFWRKAVTSVLLLLRFYPVAHRMLHDYEHTLKKNLQKENFDLVIANDAETLPLAFSFSNNPKVLFDAHEYAPRHFEDKLTWRIFFQRFNVWLCKKYIPRTAGMITVGKALAKEYEKHFHVQPLVVPNANNYFDLAPSPVENGKIQLVHMGIANRSRRLELTIELARYLDDRFTLDLYLLTPGFASKRTAEYINELKTAAMSTTNVRVLPPIKGTELVRTINSYDIGVFLLPPINFNYANTLPNKLFDFIQARLGIAIGPTPEMAEIVNFYGNGVVADNFTPESLALKMNQLTHNDIITFKQNSARAAKDFNAEKNAAVMQQMISRILH
jgi:glycosyltransferase involved in cell wall biosynthesis